MLPLSRCGATGRASTSTSTRKRKRKRKRKGRRMLSITDCMPT
jgi:hypothetical protein